MDRRSVGEVPPTEPVSRGCLRQQVSARIMMGIFRGRFRSGQRLVVQDLARAYQASPTPVREALVEMASLGLVDLLPNRGAILLPFGPRETWEICEIRRLLEVEAARRASGHIPAGDLSALEQDLVNLDTLPHDHEWDRMAREVDTRLHGLIADCCGSRRLAAEIGRYSVLFRTLRDVSHQRDALTNFSRSNDVPEHLAIVSALMASDAAGAANAMDRHIRSVAMKLNEVIFSIPNDPEGDRESKDSGPSAEPPTPAAGGPLDNGRVVPE